VVMDADLQNDPRDIPRLLRELEEWDAVSGGTFRAFRGECLRGLVLYRGFHRFVPTLLRMRGYRVIEISVNHRPRRFGRSKYGVLDRVFAATADLFVVRWMTSRRLRYEVAEDLGGELIRD